MSEPKNIYVQALFEWQSFLENELAALGVSASAVQGSAPEPSPGLIPEGIDTLEWLTVQSSDYASTVEIIVRHYVTKNEWPSAMTSEQVFYTMARLAGARAWITFVIEEGIPDGHFNVMPSLHDRNRMLEWLLITAWRDFLPEQILGTMADVIDKRAGQNRR
jgi:hypothetical protein